MENLGSLFLVLPVSSAHATRSSMTAVWMMAVVEGKEDLHEIVPDGIFWNETIMSLCLLDDGGEVAIAAVLHEDVHDACFAVDVAVMVAYNMFMVEIFEDVAMRVFATSAEQPGTRGRCGSVSVRELEIGGGHDAHFGDDELLVAL